MVEVPGGRGGNKENGPDLRVLDGGLNTDTAAASQNAKFAVAEVNLRALTFELLAGANLRDPSREANPALIDPHTHEQPVNAVFNFVTYADMRQTPRNGAGEPAIRAEQMSERSEQYMDQYHFNILVQAGRKAHDAGVRAALRNSRPRDLEATAAFTYGTFSDEMLEHPGIQTIAARVVNPAATERMTAEARKISADLFPAATDAQGRAREPQNIDRMWDSILAHNQIAEMSTSFTANVTAPVEAQAGAYIISDGERRKFAANWPHLDRLTDAGERSLAKRRAA